MRRVLIYAPDIDKMLRYERAIRLCYNKIVFDAQKVARLDAKRKTLIEEIGKEKWEAYFRDTFYPDCKYEVIDLQGSWVKKVKFRVNQLDS